MSDIGKLAGLAALFTAEMVAAGLFLGLGFKLADKLIAKIGGDKNK